MNDSTEDRDVDVRGLQLRVRIAGPAGGAPVLLVHGWKPEDPAPPKEPSTPRYLPPNAAVPG